MMITPGTFVKISKAVPPAAMVLFATFTIKRSAFCSKSGRVAVTTAASNIFEAGLRVISTVAVLLSSLMVKDSENVSEKAVQFPEEREDSIINKNNFETIKRPPVDSNGNAAGDGEKKKVNVEIKVFRNLESSGFGYDIILDGHTYVHQPNIPALPGNNGFSTEEKARSVAELVSFKIRNNIMPPTVEVRELDSLRVR